MATNWALINLFVIFLFTAVFAEDLSSSEKDTINSGIDAGVNISEAIAAFGDPKTSRMFNALGKMASFLGAAGGFVSLILVFLPERDSAELAYMKKQFTLVNTKLDKITAELDNIKNLIEFENQKAAYLSSAHAILRGHKQMQRLFNELQRTRCTKATCPRIRARIAQRYKASLNVKSHLEKILHGTVKRTSVFGKPLLDLVKKTFECDFSKINQFTNGILKLAFKGQQVALVHEKLVGSKHSITESMNEWLKNVYNLREKSFVVKQECFKTIKDQMIKDIGNTDYQIRSSTNDIANAKVKRFLEAKYPWIRAVPFSYSAYGSDKHCVSHTYGNFLNMPSDKNARKRVLVVGLADKTGTYDTQKNKILNEMRSISKNTDFYRERRDCCKILARIRKELERKNIWKYIVTLNVRKRKAGFRIIKGNDLTVISKKFQLHYVYRRKNRRRRRTFSVYVTMVLKSIEQAERRGCDLRCQNNGQCKQYPYSSMKYCQCKPFYQGEKCQENSEAALAKTVDVMVAETLKLPVLSDVYFDIKDLRRFVGISFVNMQKGISNLEATIQRKFDQLARVTTNNFKWANLVVQYSKYIQRIDYFAHLFERLPLDYKDKQSQQRMGKKYANEVLHVSRGIMKALFHLNDLLVGMYHKPLQRHKAILLLFMEKKAGEPCTRSYKQAVDNYWGKLILLQQLGYMVWAQALAFIGKKTDIVNSTYKRRLAKQLNVIKTKTCDYSIANSENVQCVGHYLQPDMKIRNKCNRNYYVTGSLITSCTRKTSHCRRCQCYRPGSVSLQCSDLHGKCRCKRSFYGQNCNNRACVWGGWSRYGRCSRCGYGAKKRRSRSVRVNSLGNGRKCQGSRYSYASCFIGCCRNQYHCSRRRKCIRSSWKCDYDNDCGDHQDEHGCNEQCFYRHTRLSSYGGGRVVYLDRYRPQCPSRSALKYFRLQRIGNQVRYKYICCRLNKDICRNQQRYSGYTYAVHNSKARRLTGLSVNCPGSAYISGFKLQRNRHHNGIRYSYNCCFLKHQKHKRRSTCYERQTRWTYDGSGNLVYLDRQYVGCNNRYFLSYFRLQHKSVRKSWGRRKGYFRYHYRCCKINS